MLTKQVIESIAPGAEYLPCTLKDFPRATTNLIFHYTNHRSLKRSVFAFSGDFGHFIVWKISQTFSSRKEVLGFKISRQRTKL